MRFVLSGDGSLKVTLRLNLTDGQTTQIYTIVTVTPVQGQASTIEKNLYKKMKTDGKDSLTIIGIELKVEESQPSTSANKTILFDTLDVYRIAGWQFVDTPKTTENSVASSDGKMLVISADPAKELRLRKQFLYPYINATQHRIFQWREKVGYSSNVNITAVNSTQSSFTFEDDNANWAIVSEDIARAGDVTSVEVTLEAGAEDGEANLDWIRIVEPYVSQFAWGSFADGSWEPWGGLIMESLSYVPEPPAGGPHTPFTGTTTGHTAQIWASYQGNPGDFVSGTIIDPQIHNAVQYEWIDLRQVILGSDSGRPVVRQILGKW